MVNQFPKPVKQIVDDEFEIKDDDLPPPQFHHQDLRKVSKSTPFPQVISRTTPYDGRGMVGDTAAEPTTSLENADDANYTMFKEGDFYIPEDMLPPAAPAVQISSSSGSST